VDDVELGKLPIRPSERWLAILPTEASSSKSEGTGRRKFWILSTKGVFHNSRDLLHVTKPTTCGVRLYFPSGGRRDTDFYRP
jgi:hypothetical protein